MAQMFLGFFCLVCAVCVNLAPPQPGSRLRALCGDVKREFVGCVLAGGWCSFIVAYSKVVVVWMGLGGVGLGVGSIYPAIGLVHSW
jgi:hypothetical protein